MPVYMIQAGKDGPIKIGWSRNPNGRGRLSQLQTAHYEELRIVRIIEESIEGVLHRYFGANLIRGEWFHFSPEMLTVTVAELMSLSKRGALPPHPLSDIRKANARWGGQKSGNNRNGRTVLRGGEMVAR